MKSLLSSSGNSEVGPLAHSVDIVAAVQRDRRFCSEFLFRDTSNDEVLLSSNIILTA